MLSRIQFLHITLISIFISVGTALDPFAIGPHEVRKANINQLGNFGLDHSLVVWAPQSNGSFPVIYFSSGLAGGLDPNDFDTVMERISSHGFVIIAPHLAIPINQYPATWLDGVIQWCQDHLKDKLVGDGFDDRMDIDFESVFLLGHSAGNHVMVNYMKMGCHDAKGMIMISPVDGADPFGLIPDFCIEPGKKLNFDIPALIIPVGLDSVPGVDTIGNWYPACAPEDFSNQRFYDAMVGNVWWVNATEYGHLDLMDPDFVADVGSFCKASTLEDLDPYRHFLAAEVVSFVRGIQYEECELFGYLENPDLMTVQVEVRQQRIHEDYCGNGQCIWQEPVGEH